MVERSVPRALKFFLGGRERKEQEAYGATTGGNGHMPSLPQAARLPRRPQAQRRNMVPEVGGRLFVLEFEMEYRAVL